MSRLITFLEGQITFKLLSSLMFVQLLARPCGLVVISGVSQRRRPGFNPPGGKKLAVVKNKKKKKMFVQLLNITENEKYPK